MSGTENLYDNHDPDEPPPELRPGRRSPQQPSFRATASGESQGGLDTSPHRASRRATYVTTNPYHFSVGWIVSRTDSGLCALCAT